jgi:hypothetical protein
MAAETPDRQHRLDPDSLAASPANSEQPEPIARGTKVAVQASLRRATQSRGR